MNEATECRTCLMPVTDPEICELCDAAVCSDCACRDENLLHVWCEECAEALPKEPCRHCWHTEAITKFMTPKRPTQYQQACCHCGEKRVKQDAEQEPVKHGPFAPALTLPGPRVWEREG